MARQIWGTYESPFMRQAALAGVMAPTRFVKTAEGEAPKREVAPVLGVISRHLEVAQRAGVTALELSPDLDEDRKPDAAILAGSTALQGAKPVVEVKIPDDLSELEEAGAAFVEAGGATQ